MAAVTSVSNQRNKIVLLGEQSAGKTSIVTRFVYDHYIPAYAATIGIDFLSKVVTVNQKTMRLQLWDTAGQERFRSLMPSYIRDSSSAIVVYDITNRESFERTRQWIKDIKDMRGDKAVIVVVGNKTDLLDKRYVYRFNLFFRTVSYEEGENLAKEMNCFFRETSAKNGDNVHELFTLVATELLKTIEPEPVSDKLVDIDLKPSAPAENTGCVGRGSAGFSSLSKVCHRN